MNTPTIEMEREVAVAKLEAYELAIEKNPKLATRLDREVMQGYRVVARGGRLVDVHDAIRHGGTDLAGHPKLAIARASAPWTTYCYSGMSDSGRFFWAHPNRSSDGRFLGDNYSWLVQPGTFDPNKVPRTRVKALTPLIPLPLRPKAHLGNFFLLWEANWLPDPPRDPYLLRPIAGSLMEILAEWDVTPLELAAVRNAMRSAGA
jgi:hypothetical protein